MATLVFSLASLLFLITIYLSTCESSRKVIRNHHRKYDEENDVYGSDEVVKSHEKDGRWHLNTDENEVVVEDSKEIECHKSAVWHCGHTLIKVFKFLDYLPNEQVHQSKCALRNAFFSCLKTSKQNSCNKLKRKATQSEKFRKRLANTLWSTRTCIMGINL